VCVSRNVSHPARLLPHQQQRLKCRVAERERVVLGGFAMGSAMESFLDGTAIIPEESLCMGAKVTYSDAIVMQGGWAASVHAAHSCRMRDGTWHATCEQLTSHVTATAFGWDSCKNGDWYSVVKSKIPDFKAVLPR
jgi:hypothetical protein